jgi:hypothetical protein
MAKEGKHAQDPQIMLALLCGATVEGAARSGHRGGHARGSSGSRGSSAQASR